MNLTDTNLNFLIKITHIIGYYLIPIISAIGFVLNIFCIVNLLNIKFNQRMYRLLVIKIVFETITCLIGIGFQNVLCFKNCFSTLSSSVFFKTIGIMARFMGEVSFIGSSLSEIGLNYDRYLILVCKKNWFNQTKIRNVLFVYISIGIIMFIPECFAYKASNEPKDSNDTFFDYSDFGKSISFSYYILISLAIGNSTTIISLTIMNVFLILEYKRFIKKKISLVVVYKLVVSTQITITANKNKALKSKRSDICFTKMIIILNVIFVAVRLSDLISVILFRKDKINQFELNSVTVLYRDFNFLLIFLSYGLNALILFHFNKDFKENVKKIFSFIFHFRIFKF